MADARVLELPLVGGGDHDWNTIFTRWNVLSYDTDIAGTVRCIAWTGMALAVLWAGWRWWCDRKSPADAGALDGKWTDANDSSRRNDD
jgi:hypothetical protein